MVVTKEATSTGYRYVGTHVDSPLGIFLFWDLQTCYVLFLQLPCELPPNKKTVMKRGRWWKSAKKQQDLKQQGIGVVRRKNKPWEMVDRNCESALTVKVFQFFMSTSAYRHTHTHTPPRRLTHSQAYVNASVCPPISSSLIYISCVFFFWVCFRPSFISSALAPPPLFVWVRRLPLFRFLLLAQITTHNFHITSAYLDACVCVQVLSVLPFFCSSGMRLFVAFWRRLMLRYGNQYS